MSPIIVGGIGMVAERMLIRRLYDKEPLISLIVTFAFALLIEATVRLIYGGIGQPFSPPPFMAGFLIWGPILVTQDRVRVVPHTPPGCRRPWACPAKTPLR